MANDSINFLVGGKPYVASQNGDGKIHVKTPDGKTDQAMEVNEFKKYLADHANELQIAPPEGDTVQIAGKEGDKTSFKGSDPEKKGGIGKTILGLAILTGVGIWQKKNIVKLWNKFFKKAGEEVAQKFDGKGALKDIQNTESKTVEFIKDGLRQSKDDTVYVLKNVPAHTNKASEYFTNLTVA